MFGIAPRLNVKIGVIAGRALSLDGIPLTVLCKLLNLSVDLLVDQVTLLHPAFGSAGTSDFHEAAVAVEHIDALAIFHQSNFGVDRRNAITQVDLRGGHVSNFQHASASAIARGKNEGATKRDREDNS